MQVHMGDVYWRRAGGASHGPYLRPFAVEHTAKRRRSDGRQQPSAQFAIEPDSKRRKTEARRQPSPPRTAQKKSEKCDKCDGPHPTDECPHFKKPREQHKDAWQNYGRKDPVGMGASGGNVILNQARIVPQPGDGSCLYHSILFGIRRCGLATDVHNAVQLRRRLANWVCKNGHLDVGGNTIEEWVAMDDSVAESTVQAYAKGMICGTRWGGGIELTACVRVMNVNIHVYERMKGHADRYKRISCFDSPRKNGSTKTISILYRGAMHYDALIPGREWHGRRY